MAKDSAIKNYEALKENYYALIIAIVKKASVSQALRSMGLSEGMYESELKRTAVKQIKIKK